MTQPQVLPIGRLAQSDAISPSVTGAQPRARAWVNTDASTDVARLSAQSKLRAIRALLGGWHSSEDMAAIRKICGSVKSSSEAAAIRAGVDLLSVSDLGQRTTLRVIFAQMP
jgi:hypothetical protein